jgi:hypothetical protein
MDNDKQKALLEPQKDIATANAPTDNAVPENLADTAKVEFERNRKYAPHAGQGIDNIGDIPNDSWIKPKHWTDTPNGRYAIEFISRFVGGMFYSWMDNSRQLKELDTYDPHRNPANANSGWIVKLASLTDKVLNPPLRKIFTATKGEKAADELLRFREITHNFDEPKKGHSLGTELVKVTVPFASMSVGTGLARNILLGVLNPTERAGWLENGKFSLSHIAKRTLSKAWEIVSYNAGEDFAVALPYVYYMRMQRNALDKIYPGFKTSAHLSDNGGGFHINTEGKVDDNFQWAGFWDMEGRFTVYNVFTQIFRDSYDKVAVDLKKWQKNDFAITPPEFIKDPASIPEKMVETAKGTTRYLAISTIRSLLQMLPSVPWFSLFRVPALKNQGLAVNTQAGQGFGALGYKDEHENFTPIRAGKGMEYAGEAYKDKPLYWSENGQIFMVKDKAENMVQGQNPFAGKDPYGYSKGRLDRSATAKMTDWIGSGLHAFSSKEVWANATRGFWTKVVGLTEEDDIRKHSKTAIMTGIPYAFYFAEKVRRREKYTNEQMNLAIGRFIDGVTSFDMHEIREGKSEITRTMMGLPFKEPNRQAELIENHLHHPTDKSPIPENWSAEQHREYLEQHQAGTAPDALKLTSKISQNRADNYAKKAAEQRKESTTGKAEASWAEHHAATAQQPQALTLT